MYIVDRTKDMLLCGGFNVYPRNIEEAIYQHPSVSEVSVIGVPDAYRGEIPKAFIKLKAGAPPLTLEELKVFLKDRLGKHEMIGAMEIRDELPKTPVGKISKKELRAYETRAHWRLTAKTGATVGDAVPRRKPSFLTAAFPRIYAESNVYPGRTSCRSPSGATALPSAFRPPWWRRCGSRKAMRLRFSVAGERAFAVARKPGRKDFLERLRAFRGRLPPDFKFDRDEANAR